MYKKIMIIAALALDACTFNAAGIPGNDADAGADGSAAPDGCGASDAAPPDAAPPDASSMATIVCSQESVDGRFSQVLTLGGDIESGFLGSAPLSAKPVRIEYGSDFDDPSDVSNCPNLYAVPYPSGCPKPYAAWGPSPRLVLDLRVDNLNLALVYDDGTVRWGDLKTTDGDDVGFAVSGGDCRILLTDGGNGGYIRIDP